MTYKHGSGELRFLEEKQDANSTCENFLSWTVVNFPKYSFDHVNSADDSSEDTDEGEIDGKRSETPRQCLPETPFLLSDSSDRVDFQSVSSESCTLNFDLVGTVRSPVHAKCAFAKTPRFDHEKRPTGECDSEDRVEGETEDPEDTSDG